MAVNNRARKSMAHQDADSRVPRYLQVASVLRRRIRDGHWLVGDKIATLEELEREFSVARVTVRQANGSDIVLLRERIAKIQASRQSMMPEGLEEGLTAQDLADLLDFILANAQ